MTKDSKYYPVVTDRVIKPVHCTHPALGLYEWTFNSISCAYLLAVKPGRSENINIYSASFPKNLTSSFDILIHLRFYILNWFIVSCFDLELYIDETQNERFFYIETSLLALYRRMNNLKSILCCAEI